MRLGVVCREQENLFLFILCLDMVLMYVSCELEVDKNHRRAFGGLLV
jgi:hypothetical protein